MSGLTTVSYFLVSLIFSTLTFLLWVRFALRYFRISALHSFSQTIDRLTYPIVKPIQFIYPFNHGRSQRIDWACITTLILIELLKFILFYLILAKTLPFFPIILLQVIGELVVQPCNLLFYAILIRVIISWVNPTLNNPMMDLLYVVTEPLLRRARAILPVFSGIDFSPFIVLVGLKIIVLFISASLPPSIF